jgi:hypothetical protein
MGVAKWIRGLGRREKPIAITFTGGMGAQIISAAIYFFMRQQGQAVYADLSYFNQIAHLATVGKAGDVSHWGWQLDGFGLNKEAFEPLQGDFRREVELIEDGPKKVALGLQALQQPEVQAHFSIKPGVQDGLPACFSEGYLCVHVRRGDYVNVASHLVSDEEFFYLTKKFAGLVKYLAVVSDSPIEEAFRERIVRGGGYMQVAFMDNVDAFTTHRIMRNARILVCSNSQFSLIAALLNTAALVVLPKQWFGANDRAIEAPIHEVCGFQILGRP